MSKTVQKQARQGDLLFIKVGEAPKNAKKAKDNVLAYGEVTGHSHRAVSEVEGGVAVLETPEGNRYVNAKENWTAKHEEHGHITLEPGIWEVRRQREYADGLTRKVVD